MMAIIIKSSQVNSFSSIYGTKVLHEVTAADCVPNFCHDLSPSLSHCSSFLLYHSPPALFWSSTNTLYLDIPIQNLPFCGRGILPQYKTNSLPFPQFDFRCHSFLLYTPPQFLVFNNAGSKNLESFPKALVCKCLQVICYSWCPLPCFVAI